MGKDLRRGSQFFLLWVLCGIMGYRMVRLPLLNGYMAPGDYKHPALISFKGGERW